MALVENDDVVEQFPPDGGDEALGDLSLPRTPSARGSGSSGAVAATSCRPLVSMVESSRLWELDHVAQLRPLDVPELRGIAGQ